MTTREELIEQVAREIRKAEEVHATAYEVESIPFDNLFQECRDRLFQYAEHLAEAGLLADPEQSAELERFIQFVRPDLESGCWVWAGHRTQEGYGRYKFRGTKWFAHRVSYTLFRAEIVAVNQDGERLVIDHTCRNRACVNPKHLRLVTNRENLLADGSLSPFKLLADRTECPRGHALAAPNLRPGHLSRGLRACLACHRGNNNVRDARVRRGVELDPQVASDSHYSRITNGFAALQGEVEPT